MILSSLAGLYGLLLLALFLLLSSDAPLSLSQSLMISSPLFVSAICGWAAYSLLKRKERAFVVAAIAWLVVGVISLWCIKAWIALEADGIHSPETLLAMIILVVTEIVIAVYLMQQRRETTT